MNADELRALTDDIAEGRVTERWPRAVTILRDAVTDLEQAASDRAILERVRALAPEWTDDAASFQRKVLAALGDKQEGKDNE